MKRRNWAEPWAGLAALLACGLVSGCTAAQMAFSGEEFLPGCTPAVEITYEPAPDAPPEAYLHDWSVTFGPAYREGQKSAEKPIGTWIGPKTPFSRTGTFGTVLCEEDTSVLRFGQQGQSPLEFTLDSKSGCASADLVCEYVDNPKGENDLWRFRIKAIPGYSETRPAPAPPARRVSTPDPRTSTLAKGCNLRTGPDTSSRVLTVLPEGTPLTVLENRPPWYRVSAAGREGWVHRTCLSGP